MVILGQKNRKIVEDFYGDRRASVRLFCKVIKIVRISCGHYTDIPRRQHVYRAAARIWLHFTIMFQ